MTTRRLRQEAQRERRRHEPSRVDLIYHLDNAKDRIAELEEALRKIASCESHHEADVVAIARAALEKTT